MQSGHRFQQLDALRGFASLSVVLLHFVDMFYPFDRLALRTPWQQWLLTLLSPFYSGHEAVVVFFLLSGFVLALPYMAGRREPYPQFLLRRIVRIYIPYLAALGVAVAGSAIWHGHLGLGDWADNCWTSAPDWRSVRDHLLFLGNYNGTRYNAAFWTLIVEMRVSIVFPLLVAFVQRSRLRVALLGAAVLMVVSNAVIGHWPASRQSMETVGYAGTFVCGILMARHRAAIAAWYRRRGNAEHLVIAAAVFIAYLWGHLLRHMSKPVILLAVIGLMVLTLNSETAGRRLQHRVPLYLGRISYSLYLVHLPVLFALAFLLRPADGQAWFLALYVASAIGFASVFHRFVEQPCIRLSRQIARPEAEEAYAKAA